MRLRQICFVSNDLENALRSFSFITGSDVCFRDEGVSYFGLKNGLLEVDGNFLEVVSPFKPNTTAERFLTRMNGDAGYMLIFECEDADTYRKKAVDLEIRAKRSKSLLENDWFIDTIRDLRQHQMNVFANRSADEVEIREDAHAILRALNAIEVSLRADVDAIEILKHKGKHRG